MTRHGTPSVQSLKERFRQAALDLAGTLPLSVASLSARPTAGGPLETVLTLGFDEQPGLELPPLVVGEAAAQWFEANRRELILDVRPEHVRSEFYRPFTRHGLRSVIVLPVFAGDDLVGTVAAGSVERDAYTKRHLKLIELLAAELAAEFPAPAPAPAAVGEERPEPSAAPLAASADQPAPAPRPAAPVKAAPANEAHIEADALGRVQEWDATAECLFGISHEEAVGKRLAVFYRPAGGRRIDSRLVDELTRRGRFIGRALGWDSEGRPVTCEVELSAVQTPGGARGFRGRFRRVTGESLLPREDIRFDFATLYAFANPVR